MQNVGRRELFMGSNPSRPHNRNKKLTPLSVLVCGNACISTVTYERVDAN